VSHDHSTLKQWAAAYVLGALEPVERAEFERHLNACASCQAEVSGLAGLPSLLARAAPDRVDDQAAVDRLTERATTLVQRDFVRQQAAGRRWKYSALGLVAATVVLLVALASTVMSGRTEDGGRSVALEPGAASGTVHVDDRPWGTEISLELQGLEHRSEYYLWAIGSDGSWSAAATWASTPGGVAILTGATSMPLDELDQVLVTSADRADILAVAKP